MPGKDFVEVLSGLSEGETVVTSANFLIDSESRIGAIGAAPAGSAGQPAQSLGEAHAGRAAAMIEKLIALCVRNKFLTIVFVAGLFGAGLWSLRTHPARRASRISPTCR